MSETALTLIKAAMRAVGALASGEVPTADESADGLEAMKLMLRNWSSRGIRLYFTTQESFALTGAAAYTIGSGGTFNTSRPSFIRGAYVRDSDGVDHLLRVVDESFFRDLSLKTTSGTSEYLWFSPEYPLGKIWLFPQGGNTIHLDSQKPLSDPSAITDTISFPPEYDEAIKYHLAVRLAPEYGREASSTVIALGKAALDALERKNFASQVVTVKPEILRVAQRFNINDG